VPGEVRELPLLKQLLSLFDPSTAHHFQSSTYEITRRHVELRVADAKICDSDACGR
jgi:hypothetical protein